MPRTTYISEKFCDDLARRIVAEWDEIDAEAAAAGGGSAESEAEYKAERVSVLIYEHCIRDQEAASA